MNTRDFQRSKGKHLLFSTVGIWEIFTSQNDQDADFLIFLAQQLFEDDLFATPSEIVTRFLENAYPENQINYSPYCNLPIAETWRRMTKSTFVKFEYDKKQILETTNLLRRLSKNIVSIIEYPSQADFPFSNIGKIIDTYYQCMLEDKFFDDISFDKYEQKTLIKLIIFFVILIMILRVDFSPSLINSFWKKHNFEDDEDNLTEKLMFFFQMYPHIFRVGPFLQMAITAYYQIKFGGRSRGLIFDCYHAIYSSYSDLTITADTGFQRLQELSYFNKRLLHISELQIFEVPFKK